MTHSRGQFLIESMVAVGIITVGLLGILTLLSNSISLNRVVAEQYTAAYLASEGIEVVKSIIDANYVASRPWNQGLANGAYELEYDMTSLPAALSGPDSTTFLRFTGGNGIYDYDLGGVNTPFLRTVTVTLSGPDQINVASRVNWVTRGAGQFSVHLEDSFFNWR